MVKTTISVTVDIETYLLAKRKIDNISEYVNMAIKSLAESVDDEDSDIDSELKAINNSLQDLKIKKDILELQLKRKQELEDERIESREGLKRWKCPVCNTINSMDMSRCGGRCGLPTRNDPKTTIVYVDEVNKNVASEEFSI